MNDFPWAATGFLTVFVAWIVAWRRHRRHISQPPKPAPVIEVKFEATGDARVAIDTLRKLGYGKEESEELVQRALRKAPNGDFQTLINIAIKQ